MAEVGALCVFCGASPGNNHRYLEAAADLGRVLGQQGIGLVYGGGSVGIMGAVAGAALEHGSRVVGVCPASLLPKEVSGDSIGELIVVDTMHERKAKMAALADGFVALPGGFGTLEELFEAITWAQLGIHAKPVGLLNVDGFFEPLVGLIDHAVTEGFIRSSHRRLVTMADSPAELLAQFANYSPPPGLVRWMRTDET